MRFYLFRRLICPVFLLSSVSTLLEILPRQKPKMQYLSFGSRKYAKFQPFLRFYFEIKERRYDGKYIAVFQPFLRFCGLFELHATHVTSK